MSTRKSIRAKKLWPHNLNMLMVFNPWLAPSPIVGRCIVWTFKEGDTIEYRDIYMFGFRIIRWQI